MIDNLFSQNRLRNQKKVDGNRDGHEIKGRIGLKLDE